MTKYNFSVTLFRMKKMLSLIYSYNAVKVFRILISIFSILGIITYLIILFHAGFCAFTWEKFTMFDYGVYMNMIWNNGTGDFFRCLLDRSYLATHLSFSLVLLGPLVHITNNPFSLWIIQWMFLVIGIIIISYTSYRHKLKMYKVSAILFFYVSYIFMQSTLLSEFHGVTICFLLIPWLYHTLCYKKKFAWLPLMLILGVREDAFIIILPMLIYFAIKDKSKICYLYVALAIAYGMFAILWLYPAINDMSLLARRHNEIGQLKDLLFLNIEWFNLRRISFLLILIPMLPFFVRRRFIYILVFPSLAIIQALGSKFPRQFMLTIHYPATIHICMIIGMIEAIRYQISEKDSLYSNIITKIMSVYLIITAIFVSYNIGFVFNNNPNKRVHNIYKVKHNNGIMALEAAKHIPRKGVLVCPTRLAAFCANRADIITWEKMDNDKYKYDIIFDQLKFLKRRPPKIIKNIISGDFGIIYFDKNFFIAERGAPATVNEVFFACL